jgi:murein DD-endopeptidase MepM/ murein hydrolase activator NlpD
MTRRKIQVIKAVALTVLALTNGQSVFAAQANTSEVDRLQAEIQNRKAEIETINSRLDEYKKRIAELTKQASSLQNDVAILENETALTQLDVAATQNAIEEENLHLSVVEAKIAEANERLAREKDLLSNLLFEINKQDKQGGTFEMIIGARNFTEVFSAAAQLQSINNDLRQTLVTTQQAKDQLAANKQEREERIGHLDELRAELDLKIAALESQATAKQVLVGEARDSEIEYRVLMSDLRQEQQGISQRISALQNEIQDKLADSDEATSGKTVITWPLTGRITTTFHDTTYPFRYLFEHSGLDIAIPVGTPIESAAPGYVAWAQTGRQYGNYVMVIHANGFATLYAHMSRIDVKVDQYVARGDIIGLSGGAAGAPGSGLSTGPHLHFELRQNGIPIDPLPNLP